MINQSYDYLSFADKTIFYFESEGAKGKIPKAIVFSQMEEDGILWNLAFGDYHKGDIDDAIVSNNHDIVKIISTVAKAAYDFSKQYPTRHIYIEPVDEKRKILYNHVFRRHYEVINTIFDIVGTTEGQDEEYSLKKNYDIFRLKRKFVV